MSSPTYRNRVFNRSCETMAEMPDGVVNSCVTSPPYFALRTYAVDGQIGLESTLDEYVARLVGVFREVGRVLRDDGTLWVNLGDSWAGNPKGSLNGQDKSGLTSTRTQRNESTLAPINKIRASGLKPKDQMLVPHTVAMALRADGWYLRDTIVWHKPQCMPSSVRDRTTTAHEYVFLLSKRSRYWYDQDAIREPLAESSVKRLAQDTDSQAGSHTPGKTNGAMKAVGTNPPRFGGNKRCSDNATYSGKAWEPKQRVTTPENDDANEGFDDRWSWGNRRRMQRGKQGQQTHPDGITHDLGSDFIGANARSVWTIATAKYPGDHYAVMPQELARRCILAGSPKGGLVLDPFAGTGTTLEVAMGCGRDFVGYELSEKYCALIRDRLGLFGGVG